MGQVLGKVLLTSRENELTIDGDLRTSGLFWFQGYLHTYFGSQGYLVLWLGFTSIIS